MIEDKMLLNAKGPIARCQEKKKKVRLHHDLITLMEPTFLTKKKCQTTFGDGELYHLVKSWGKEKIFTLHRTRILYLYELSRHPCTEQRTKTFGSWMKENVIPNHQGLPTVREKASPCKEGKPTKMLHTNQCVFLVGPLKEKKNYVSFYHRGTKHIGVP